jgi:hypothetical protein
VKKSAERKKRKTMFDKTAFKFITAFLFILLLSFTLFIAVGLSRPTQAVSPDSQLCCAVNNKE